MQVGRVTSRIRILFRETINKPGTISAVEYPQKEIHFTLPAPYDTYIQVEEATQVNIKLLDTSIQEKPQFYRFSPISAMRAFDAVYGRFSVYLFNVFDRKTMGPPSTWICQ